MDSVDSEEFFAEANASQMTPESVAAEINELGGKPDAITLQNLLDRIALVADGRDLLFDIVRDSVVGDRKKTVDRARKAAKEKARDKAKAARNKKVETVECAIPLPHWADYYAKHEGRTFAFAAETEESAGGPLHSPLRVRNALSYPDRLVQGREETRGLLLEYENEAGELKTLPFTRADALLAPKEGMIAALVNAGVGFTAAGIRAFNNNVLAASAPDGGTVYDFSGWRDGNIFITPGGVCIGETNREFRLVNLIPGIKEEGTLDGWVESVAPAFSEEIVTNAPHVPACVLWAFVSPLIDRAREEMSYLLGISKRTTGLKTFSLRVMASAWGSDEPAKGILITCSATPNAIEQGVIARSGCGLGLDDTTLLQGDLGDICYRISTGAERGRMGETPRHWRIAVALTSETPIAQLIRAAGHEPAPGLMSRVVEITGSGERISDEPVEKMRAAFRNYGHAGPAFIEAMLMDDWTRDRIVEAVNERVRALLGGSGKREQERRASRAIAYIGLAGEIAQTAGLIPADFDVDEFTSLLWDSCKGATDTTRTVVHRVCGVLSEGLRNGSIPIYDKKGDALASSDGIGAIVMTSLGPNGDPAFVLPTPTLAKIVGTRESVSDAVKILDDEGALLRERKDRLYWQEGRAGVGNVQSYAIYARAVLGDDAEGMIESHRAARLAQPNPFRCAVPERATAQ